MPYNAHKTMALVIKPYETEINQHFTPTPAFGHLMAVHCI